MGVVIRPETHPVCLRSPPSFQLLLQTGQPAARRFSIHLRQTAGRPVQSRLVSVLSPAPLLVIAKLLLELGD
jgi:hypothetical protein